MVVTGKVEVHLAFSVQLTEYQFPPKGTVPCPGVHLILQLVFCSMDWFRRRSEECQCQTEGKDGSVGARRGNRWRNTPLDSSWALNYVGCKMKCTQRSMTCFSHVR